MPSAIAMPKLGITMEEGTIVEWTTAVGSRIEKGEVALVIESEKAEVEVEAPATGFVRHYYAEPGDTVPCGTLLAAITASLEEAFDPADFAAAQAIPAEHASAEPPRTAATVNPKAAPLVRPDLAAPELRRRRGTVATPAARVRARALEIEIARVPGTGPHGRITRRDVEDWFARRSRLVPVGDGIALDVPRQGAGDPVLLLPGLGTDVSVFAAQVPALADRFLVLGVNPRGIAGSDAPDLERYSVAAAAADAARITERPAHVIGASLGAAVAIELALSTPERVRSLTLVTPFVVADARLDVVTDAWALLAGAVSSDILARALLPWLFSPGFLADPRRRDRTLRGLGQTLARAPAATLRRSVAGLHDWSGSRALELGAIAVPTLVVAAGADLLTPDAPAIAAAIPGATCLVVPDSGHAVTIESPEAVNRAILAHLAAIE